MYTQLSTNADIAQGDAYAAMSTTALVWHNYTPGKYRSGHIARLRSEHTGYAQAQTAASNPGGGTLARVRDPIGEPSQEAPCYRCGCDVKGAEALTGRPCLHRGFILIYQPGLHPCLACGR